MTQVQCPHCGGFRATSQAPVGCAILFFGFGGLAGVVSGLNEGNTMYILSGIGAFAILGYGLYEAQYRVECEICGYKWDTRKESHQEKKSAEASPASSSETSSQHQTTTDRLNELERLRSSGLISEDEYKRKREDLLRQL